MDSDEQNIEIIQKANNSNKESFSNDKLQLYFMAFTLPR